MSSKQSSKNVAVLHKRELALRAIKLLPIVPPSIGTTAWYPIFEFDEKEIKLDPSLQSLDSPTWFHFYFSGFSGNRETFWKGSFRGEFLDDGRFVWVFNRPDTPVSRWDELETALRRLQQLLVGNGSSLRITVCWHKQTETKCCRDETGFRVNHRLKNANLEGTVLIFNTYDLTNFLHELDIDLIPSLVDFYHLPTTDFSNNQFLDASEREADILKDGEEFAIFRRRLHKDLNTSPKSQLQSQKSVRPHRVWLTNKTYRWKHSSVKDQKLYFRLSKNGIVENREEFEWSGTVTQLQLKLLTYRPPGSSFRARRGVELRTGAKRFVAHLIETMRLQGLLKSDSVDKTVASIGEYWRKKREKVFKVELKNYLPLWKDNENLNALNFIYDFVQREFNLASTILRTRSTERRKKIVYLELKRHLSLWNVLKMAVFAMKEELKAVWLQPKRGLIKWVRRSGKKMRLPLRTTDKHIDLVQRLFEVEKSKFRSWALNYLPPAPINRLNPGTSPRIGIAELTAKPEVQKFLHSVEKIWSIYNRTALNGYHEAGKQIKTQKSDVKKSDIHREQQQYYCILLDKVTCEKCNSPLDPATLRDYSDFTASLIEGTMLYSPSNSTDFMLPRMNAMTVDSRSLATWESELCVFGSERCLIFCEPRITLHAGSRAGNHRDYWLSVARGIEHTVSVKSLLHILEEASVKCTRQIPKIVNGLGNISGSLGLSNFKDTIAMMERLAKDVAVILKSLPDIREVAVASSAFRAGHAIQKFDHLNEKQFQFGRILGHIDANVEQLTDFLRFFEQHRQTIDSEIRNDRTGRFAKYLTLVGLLLGVLASVFAAPGFVEAFTKVCRDVNLLPCLGRSELRPSGTIFLVGISLFGVIFSAIYAFVPVKDDRKRPIWFILALILTAISFYIWLSILPAFDTWFSAPPPMQTVISPADLSSY